MMTRTVSSVWMALFAALVTVPQPARSEIHDPAFLAALDENAQLYVADWNAASNAQNAIYESGLKSFRR